MSEQDYIEEQETSDVFTVSRTSVNYIFIAIIFWVTGIAVGYFGHQSMTDTNAQLIDKAVAIAMQEQEGSLVTIIGSALADREVAAPAQPTVAQRVTSVDGDDDPEIGPEDAPILLIEFGDFRCSFCARFHAQTLNPLLEAYDGQINFVYRDFVVLGPQSRDAALAAECADDQGVFWEYHDLLYGNQASLTGRGGLIELAGGLEIDIEQFTTCLDEETHADEIDNDYKDAVTSGARGTPAFLVNGRLVSGALPYENFASIIDEELAALEEEAEEEPQG